MSLIKVNRVENEAGTVGFLVEDLTTSANSVQKSGDTMTGPLNIELDEAGEGARPLYLAAPVNSACYMQGNNLANNDAGWYLGRGGASNVVSLVNYSSGETLNLNTTDGGAIRFNGVQKYDQQFTSIYSPTLGLLITVEDTDTVNKMYYLQIRGNGYSGGNYLPIHTDIQCYNYDPSAAIINATGVQLGQEFTVDAMLFNGKMTFWIPFIASAQTWFIKVMTQYKTEVPITLANSGTPVSPAPERRVTITPQKYTPAVLFTKLEDKVAIMEEKLIAAGII